MRNFRSATFSSHNFPVNDAKSEDLQTGRQLWSKQTKTIHIVGPLRFDSSFHFNLKYPDLTATNQSQEKEINK